MRNGKFHGLWLFILIILTLNSCNENHMIEVQGHRGFRGYYPENSIIGFRKAAELGVDVLELDICISGDDQVIVSHEPFMNPVICRTPDGERVPVVATYDYNIFRMDYEEIRLFDCGTLAHPEFPDQKIIKSSKPRLADVFDDLSKDFPDMRYNIEIKADPKMDGLFTPVPEKYVGLVVSLVQEYNMTDKISLQSFDIRILEEIRRIAPEILIALLVDVDENIKNKLATLTFKPEIISPEFSLLNEQEVQYLKNSGFVIIPWTVNTTEDLSRMISWEVDGIITDFPDRLIALLSD